MRRRYWGLSIFAIVFILVSACAAPSPGPAPAVTPIAPAPQAQPATTTISAHDTVWQKIVEQGRKEGVVVMYSSTLLAGDVSVALTEAFRNRYGIRLDILPSRGADNYERLKTEQRMGQKVADIAQSSSMFMLMLKGESMLAPVIDLPTLREKGNWLLHPLDDDPEGYFLAFKRTWYAPFINTNLVKPNQEPQSLQDFLKPQWKGKMIMSDPRTGSGSYVYYTPLVQRRIIDWSYVKDLGKQEMKYERNISAANELLMRGEVSVNIIGDSGDSPAKIAMGAPMKAISLKEGDVFVGTFFGMVAGTPHPNATKVFMNWFLSQEGMAVYANVAKQETLRKDVPNLMPQDAIPPSPTAPKIAVSMDNTVEAEKLFREGFMASLLGLKR